MTSILSNIKLLTAIIALCAVIIPSVVTLITFWLRNRYTTQSRNDRRVDQFILTLQEQNKNQGQQIEDNSEAIRHLQELLEKGDVSYKQLLSEHEELKSKYETLSNSYDTIYDLYTKLKDSLKNQTISAANEMQKL